MAGHPGEKRTFTRVATSFYWPGMRQDVRKYVAACFTCQTTKYVRDKPNGLIQPLPIPDLVWESASMDFIVGLPPSNGHTAVMVVVDRLSKYAHFGALKSGFDAPKVARLFLDTVVKLHGFPARLLSDRDSIFMSDFWHELLSLSGTKLQFTTAYHPQTDGQSEVTNRALEQYLRAFSHDRPGRWFDLLPWAELALNCSTNASIGMSPFQALYGRPPPNLFNTYSRPSHNHAVSELLAEREDTLKLLKDRIARAQLAMATSANRHRKDVEFNVGDRVLLRLQPYRQTSVAKPQSHKLGQRYFGPYEITERIGKVAYRLLLPVDSKVHDVFHVSLLRPFVASTDIATPLPLDVRNHRPRDTPIRATARRVVLVNRTPQEQWLTHWSSAKHLPPTWEPASWLNQQFPHLHLEDKALSNGGGVDTDTTQPIYTADEAQTQLDQDARSSPSEEDQTGPSKARPTRLRIKPQKYRDFIPF